MKSTTIHSLLTARPLYDEAMRLIESSDRHMCSAGLVMLQDALEIVFLAMLTEKDVDEQMALESKTFDELIGELRKAGVIVPKSGTLKALNKQRVITKHYGQLAEPVTVRGYAEAADAAISSILPQVLGKSFRDIVLADLLDAGESRDFLNEAAALLDQNKPLESLIAVRKALFVEIEHEYAIDGWTDASRNEGLFGLSISRGGEKAPDWTRNMEWIRKNVRDPIDYVQIDHERLRLDGIEWGVNTAELENLSRLTPQVFRSKKGGRWHVKYGIAFRSNEATPANSRYCLDRAISILSRKQQHTRAKRWPRREMQFDLPELSDEAPVFKGASQETKVVHYIQPDYKYVVHDVVTGFKDDESFYYISGSKRDEEKIFGSTWFSGYLLRREEGAE